MVAGASAHGDVDFISPDCHFHITSTARTLEPRVIADRAGWLRRAGQLPTFNRVHSIIMTTDHSTSARRAEATYVRLRATNSLAARPAATNAAASSVNSPS